MSNIALWIVSHSQFLYLCSVFAQAIPFYSIFPVVRLSAFLWQSAFVRINSPFSIQFPSSLSSFLFSFPIYKTTILLSVHCSFRPSVAVALKIERPNSEFKFPSEHSKVRYDIRERNLLKIKVPIKKIMSENDTKSKACDPVDSCFCLSAGPTANSANCHC